MNPTVASLVRDENGGTNLALDDGVTNLNVFWVTVEGPIGAGKTEFIKVLEKGLKEQFGQNRVFVLFENVQKLLDSGLFQLYQKDPVKYAWRFQVNFFHTRTKDFLDCWENVIQPTVRKTYNPEQDVFMGGELYKKIIIVTERCIFSDVIFMDVQYALGNVTFDEYEEYMSLNKMWTRLYPVKPNLVLYCKPGYDVDTIIDKCQERIQERNRDSEKHLVTKDYNAMVLFQHDEVFDSENITGADGFRYTDSAIFGAKVRIVHMDTTENYRDDERVALKKSKEVINHVETHWQRQKAPCICCSSDDEESPIEKLKRDLDKK